MSPAYFFSFKYSKSRQTGSGHAADSKMHYTIQFSVLMLCAKPLWFSRKMWQKLSCEQICLCPQYLKSRQTGSGHVADSKMCYMIQFSILMLCAKYQEAGLCGSQEKCDRNFLWRRRKTTDSDPYISLPLKRAGDTITYELTDSYASIYIVNYVKYIKMRMWLLINACI